MPKGFRKANVVPRKALKNLVKKKVKKIVPVFLMVHAIADKNPTFQSARDP